MIRHIEWRAQLNFLYLHLRIIRFRLNFRYLFLYGKRLSHQTLTA